MGLGILEPYAGDAPAQVPGTAILLHDDEENVQGVSKDSAIILVPKPSNSPRDPLVRTPRAAKTLHGNGIAYTAVELAGLEERPRLARNVSFHHRRRDPGLSALDRERDSGAGIWAADRED